MDVKENIFGRISSALLALRFSAVVFCALAARVSLFLYTIFATNGVNGFHTRDTVQYLAPAKELLSSGTFTVDRIADIVRTPGYPLFLTIGLYFVKMEIIVVLLQILLSIVTVFLVYKTSLVCFRSKKAATFTAGLYAFEPLSVLDSNILATETLFAFLTMLTVYTLAAFMARKKPELLLVAAFTCAAATYVRPIGVFLPFVLSLFLICFICFSKSLKNTTAIVCVVLFPLIAIGSPFLWQVRNAMETGYHGFSAIQDINMYYYNAAAVTAKISHIPYLDVQENFGYSTELQFIEHPSQRPDDQVGHFLKLRSKAEMILSNHWPQFLLVHIQGIFRMLVDPGSTGFLQFLGLEKKIDELIGPAIDKGICGAIAFLLKEHPLVFWSNAILGVVLLCYYLLMAYGFSTSPKNAPVYLVTIVFVYFVVLSGGASAVSRFRHPIMPIVCIFAGLGLCFFHERYIRFRRARKRSG